MGAPDWGNTVYSLSAAHAPIICRQPRRSQGVFARAPDTIAQEPPSLSLLAPPAWPLATSPRRRPAPPPCLCALRRSIEPSCTPTPSLSLLPPAWTLCTVPVAAQPWHLGHARFPASPSSPFRCSCCRPHGRTPCFAAAMSPRPRLLPRYHHHHLHGRSARYPVASPMRALPRHQALARASFILTATTAREDARPVCPTAQSHYLAHAPFAPAPSPRARTCRIHLNLMAQHFYITK